MSVSSEVRKENLPTKVLKQGVAAINGLEYATSGRLKDDLDRDRDTVGNALVVKTIIANDSSNGQLRDAAKAAGIPDTIVAASETSQMRPRYVAVIGAFVDNSRELQYEELKQDESV